MTILHVITGLQKAAGTTTFVENVVREQRLLGHTVDICTNQECDKFLCSPSPSTFTCSIIHIHGLWSPLLHKAARFVRNYNIPVVWSTHGMTAPWSLHHKWWKKCFPWYLYQLPDLRSAALIHCTTDLEADWNRALGFKNVFVAPLGTNLPDGRGGCPQPPATRSSAVKTLLYVGRIYPVKALDNVIRAAALMKQPLKFRFVGPDQAGHKAELEKLANELGVRDKIDFAGPKYDNELSAEYDNCDGLILASHTENFGATVIDALAHSKPVITSTNTPWKIVADKGCGWWVDNSPESLAKTFDEFAAIPASACRDEASRSRNLHLLGQRGLALVQAEYTWPAIAKNLVSNYERVVHA